MAEQVAQAVNYQNSFGCLARRGWLSGWHRRSTIPELLWLFSQAWMAERVAQAVNYQNSVCLNLEARKATALSSLTKDKKALLKQFNVSLAAVRREISQTNLFRLLLYYCLKPKL
jgi:hypothetical protein